MTESILQGSVVTCVVDVVVGGALVGGLVAIFTSSVGVQQKQLNNYICKTSYV